MLDIDDPSTLRVLEKLGLSDAKPIGIGTTAVVFPDDAFVLRLTMDYASHCFLVEASKKVRLATPIVIADKGVVGRYTGDCDEESFYLAQIERLQPLANHSKEKVMRWLDFFDENHPDGLQFDGEQAFEHFAKLIPRWAREHLPPQPMVETFKYLATRHFWNVDLNHTNFMVRRTTGEILLTDPVHD